MFENMFEKALKIGKRSTMVYSPKKRSIKMLYSNFIIPSMPMPKD